MALTARQQTVLQIIVDEYVLAPLPVASDVVTLKMPTRLSSATVRNEIALLAEEGYINRPHTSAGGVPSDKGYRAYVESLGDNLEPSFQVKQTIREHFSEAGLDVEATGRTAARLLAELVHTMAISTIPFTRMPRWRHLEVVHIQGLLVLLIMVMQGSTKLRQLPVLLKEPVTQDQLTRISNKLNFEFDGLSINQIKARDVELSQPERDIAGVAVDLLKREDETSLPNHFIDGLRHMFSYPELSQGTRAQSVAELLEYQQLVPLLIAEAPETGAVRVNIGSENRNDILSPFTVVFARYDTPSEGSGVIGVMGPTRFKYATAITNVRYLASVMTASAEQA